MRCSRCTRSQKSAHDRRILAAHTHMTVSRSRDCRRAIHTLQRSRARRLRTLNRSKVATAPSRATPSACEGLRLGDLQSHKLRDGSLGDMGTVLCPSTATAMLCLAFAVWRYYRVDGNFVLYSQYFEVGFVDRDDLYPFHPGAVSAEGPDGAHSSSMQSYLSYKHRRRRSINRQRRQRHHEQLSQVSDSAYHESKAHGTMPLKPLNYN